MSHTIWKESFGWKSFTGCEWRSLKQRLPIECWMKGFKFQIFTFFLAYIFSSLVAFLETSQGLDTDPHLHPNMFAFCLCLLAINQQFGVIFLRWGWDDESWIQPSQEALGRAPSEQQCAPERKWVFSVVKSVMKPSSSLQHQQDHYLVANTRQKRFKLVISDPSLVTGILQHKTEFNWVVKVLLYIFFTESGQKKTHSSINYVIMSCVCGCSDTAFQPFFSLTQ